MTHRHLINLLSPLAEPQYATFSKSLMPGRENIMGVRVPAMRQIAKDILKADWRQFIEQGPCEVFEVTFVRGLVIAQAKMEMTERLQMLTSFADEVDNWSVCDTTFGAMRHVIKKSKVATDVALLKVWAETMASDVRTYARRAAAVVVLSCFASADDMEWSLSVLQSIDCRGEHYVEMGVAWALSVLYFVDKDRVGKAIDDLSDPKVKALAKQKIRESRRV